MKGSKKSVGIDTNILIYLSKFGQNLNEIEDESERELQRIHITYSQRLIDKLRHNDTQIHLSLISVAEYLVKIEASNRADVRKNLERIFVFSTFNARAAMHAAEIVSTTTFRKRASRESYDRSVLMSDTKIIASLIAAGVSEIYLADRKAQAMASQYVTAKLLPTTPSDLLELAEDKEASQGSSSQ